MVNIYLLIVERCFIEFCRQQSRKPRSPPMPSPATLLTALLTGRDLADNLGAAILYSGNEGVTANFKLCAWLLNTAQGKLFCF